MKCTCNIGPGKFEGESALCALAYNSAMNGGSDEDFEGVDFFRAPYNFDADADHENVEFAHGLGYCKECIQAALETESYGCAVVYSEQGFVHVEEFATREEYELAISESASQLPMYEEV